MKVNLFDVKDQYGYESKWWKHISSATFGFHDKLNDIGSYEVEENDILYLNQRAPEGYFEKFWFIVTDMGVERTDLAEVKEVLSERLVDFVKTNKKFPYCCIVAKIFKNKKVQVNFEPSDFDKVVFKFSPGDFGIEDVQEFFEGLSTVTVNPADTGGSIQSTRKVSPKPKPTKTKLFPADRRIIVHRGEIREIQESTRKYEDEVYTVFILRLENGAYELEGENEEPFHSVIAQISEKMYERKALKIGDTVFLKGKTKNDRKLGDIIHNIRTLNKI